jgi:hypothetical protein
VHIIKSLLRIKIKVNLTKIQLTLALGRHFLSPASEVVEQFSNGSTLVHFLHYFLAEAP